MPACLLIATAALLQPTPVNTLADFLKVCPRGRVSFTFEHLDGGDDLSGRTLHGVTFHAPAARLMVVEAYATYSPYEFFEDIRSFRKGEPDESPVTRPVDPSKASFTATSGEYIISPGGPRLGAGPDPPLENDDLTLTFDPPIQAFGFDLLSQSRDGQSNTSIRILDGAGVVLYQGDIPIRHSDGLAGGSDFWGIMLPTRTITRIEIDDRDDNDRYPDCNIGFDSLRIFPQPCPIDFNGDASITIGDLNRFMCLYVTKSPDCDFNGDERVDAADVDAVTAAFPKDFKRGPR